MTRMRMCGRRVNAASDDFCCPAGCSAGGRLLWILMITPLLSVAFTSNSATCSTLSEAFLVAILSFNICGLLLDCGLCYKSSRGTLADDSSRKHVSRLVSTRLIFAVIDAVISILGLIAIVTSEVCVDVDEYTGFVIILIVFASITTAVTCSFLLCSSSFWLCGIVVADQHHQLDEALRISSDRWARRCRRMSCCCKRLVGVDDTFDTVGGILAAVFETSERLGLTLSDIAAGLMLVRAVQKGEEQEQMTRQLAMREARRSTELRVEPSSYPTSKIERWRFEQRVHALQHPVFPSPPEGTPLDFTNPGDYRLLTEAAHFSAFALASYGWMIFAWDNFYSWCCKLPALACWYNISDLTSSVDEDSQHRRRDVLCKEHYETSHRSSTEGRLVRGDTCGCNEVALRRMLVVALQHDIAANIGRPDIPQSTTTPEMLATGATAVQLHSPLLDLRDRTVEDQTFQPADILSTSHTNRFFTVPWFLAIDRRTGSLVVTVRGTLSMDDCITDAMAEPVDVFHHSDDLTSHVRCLFDRCQHRMHHNMVHGGMWRAAKDIRDSLLRGNLLESAMPPAQHPLNSQACELPAGYQRCDAATHTEPLHLVICGHSLGAGVATLLSLLLKPFFPALRCFAFAPPGAVTSHDIAQLMEQWVTTIIIGKDMVSRMSLPTLSMLMNDTVSYTVKCKVNKPSLMTASCAQCCVAHGPSCCKPCCHPRAIQLCCKVASCHGFFWKVDAPLAIGRRRTFDYQTSHLVYDDASQAPSTPLRVALEELQQARRMLVSFDNVTGSAKQDAESSTTSSDASAAPETPRTGCRAPPTASDAETKGMTTAVTGALGLVDAAAATTQAQQGSAPQRTHSNNRLSSLRMRRIRYDTPMSVPGKVIHLTRANVYASDAISLACQRACRCPRVTDVLVSIFCCFCRRVERVHQAHWAPRTSFSRILISADMLRDHMPDVMRDTLYTVAHDAGHLRSRRIPVASPVADQTVDAESLV